MKYVITNYNEIVAIVATKDLADHMAKFLPGKIEVLPLSDFDWCWNTIKDFIE